MKGQFRMGSSCVKFRVSPGTACQTQAEQDFGFSIKDCEINQMAMIEQPSRATDAKEREKPWPDARPDATTKKLYRHAKESKENAQETASNVPKNDSRRWCMADKVQSQFNYFPPIIKNNDI